MKYQIWVRDLTTGTDMKVWLPKNETDFGLQFNRNHEYIIVDHGNELNPDEFSNIKELNNFLLYCESEGIQLAELKILSETFLYEEVIEKIRERNYIIFDVDSETEDWLIFVNEERWGRYMYEKGFNTFECKVPEKLMDYIDWEANWNNLACSGWRVVKIDTHDYIVR